MGTRSLLALKHTINWARAGADVEADVEDSNDEVGDSDRADIREILSADYALPAR